MATVPVKSESPTFAAEVTPSGCQVPGMPSEQTVLTPQTAAHSAFSPSISENVSPNFPREALSSQEHSPNPSPVSTEPIPGKRSEALDAIIGRAFLTGLSKFLSGATSRWFSQPDTCQRVYFANHTSHLDIMVIWSSLPDYVRRYVRPVAAKDYWTNGFFKPYIASRLFNAILLERQHVKAHQNPIDDMLREMGDRYSIIIFPEGGRQSSGQIAEFKSGLYYMCKKRPELELIPIYIDNMNRILPRGTYLPVPLLSQVTFGPPLWLEKNEKKNDFLERARQAVIDLKNRQN